MLGITAADLDYLAEAPLEGARTIPITAIRDRGEHGVLCQVTASERLSERSRLVVVPADLPVTPPAGSREERMSGHSATSAADGPHRGSAHRPDSASCSRSAIAKQARVRGL